MKKKVLIICPFTYPSGCGIWKRVYDDAKGLMDEGYEVHVFSSNILKGTNQILPKTDEFEGIKIYRFKVWFRLAGSSMFFFFTRKFFQLNPSIVHVHGYRHPHSLQGLILSKLSRIKVLMTPHAPFAKDPRRSIVIKIFDKAYDILIGWWELKLYKKIVLTTNWELEYLKRLFVKDNKTVYISNGIDPMFLKDSEEVEKKIKENFREFKKGSKASSSLQEPLTILFMGRLDPVKRLEWLIEACKRFPQLQFRIVGPLSGYKKFEYELPNLEIEIKTFNKEDFINEADKSQIYVIPSIRESFGITAVEAMARGNLVLFSNVKAATEYIVNEKNGFIFSTLEELIDLIQKVTENWENLEEIRLNGLETAKRYDVRKAREEIGQLYNSIL